jgi:hypothetical protein
MKFWTFISLRQDIEERQGMKAAKSMKGEIHIQTCRKAQFIGGRRKVLI